MTDFNLTIKPALPINVRHKLIDFLEQEGYISYATGQYTDDSECDIQFKEKGLADEISETKRTR